MSVFLNRIDKNFKKLKSYLLQQKTNAYRLYDRDIPEYQYIVDIYADHAVIYDKTDPIIDKDKNFLDEVTLSVQKVTDIPQSKIIIKKREKQKGSDQYSRLSTTGSSILIEEGPVKFKVNLLDYLDSGLFLDHRPMRSKIRKIAQEKSLLNLFCYTGSMSVAAALGGANTTSVDMSQNYLNWAMDNFQLNEIDLSGHQFINANVLEWMKQQGANKKWDIIFLDPPTFSNSKKMQDFFEIEKDQDLIVNWAMSHLSENGILFFSGNKRKFKLSNELMKKYHVKDISDSTIPLDFHDKKIHFCYEIRSSRNQIIT